MSLYKQVIALPVSGGIDTKVAPQLLEAGMFLDLQNTVRRKTGQLEKRYGFRKISNLTLTGQEIVSGRRLDTFIDELLLINNTNLYSYITSQDRWTSKGELSPSKVDAEFIASDSGVKVMPDSDTLNGLECAVWEDSRGGVRCTLTSLADGTTIIFDQVVAATGKRPKVVGIRSTFVITYIVGSDFRCRRIEVGNPSVLIAEQTIEAGITDYPYDLTTYGDRQYGIFIYNKASALRIGGLLQTGQVANLLNSGMADPIEISLLGQNAVSIVADSPRQLLYAFYHNSSGTQANILRVTALSFPMLTQLGSGTVESTTNVRNITGVADTGGVVNTFYEISGSTPSTHSVNKNTVSAASGSLVIGASGVFRFRVGLATKAFDVGGKAYVTLVHESVLQSTYFTVNVSAHVVAKMRASKASGLSRDTNGNLKSGLPRIYATGMRYTSALAVRSRLVTVNSSIPSAFVGISRQTVEFNNSEFDTAILGGNLSIAGGVMSMYDGSFIVEQGFNLYPEGVTLNSFQDGTGGPTPGATYLIRAVYEWVDAQGQLHQSAPSPPVPITLGASDNRITATVPTLTLTAKRDVKVVVYSTLAGGTTVYYRSNSTDNLPLGGNNLPITLTRGDASLAQQEILYTTGGVLENIAPPAALVTHTHKNRLWVGGSEDGNLWYSRQFVEGEGVAFSDGQIIAHPKITALGTLASRLVIFREREIHTLSGDGPTDTGIQNDYGVPELLPGDVGCSNQKSLVDTPAGLIFKSLKGFYLLDGALRLRYIGDKVEKFNNLTVTSAVLLKENNEVRFTTLEGRCLVYNYYFKEWSTFTNHEAISAIQYKDLFYHLKEDGLVNRETVGEFNDNGARYSMKIETAWFKFAKLQGFQRLYRWALLGEFVSNHYTKVSVAYDYENYYADPTYFDTITGLEQSTYGTGVYGEGDYGGGSSVYQFRSKPEQQKCESFKLLIEDVDTVTPAGGGSFKLDTISFELGLKGGLYKMSNAKTRGQ